MTPHDLDAVAARLTRREVVAAGGALGLGASLYLAGRGGGEGALAAVAAATGACTLTPELTDGPYYIDDHLMRSDIREDRPGVVLDLRLPVTSASACRAIAGATVEIWHADALGVYSGFGTGRGKTFLRGGVKTDSRGLARFRTIYPGWYQGRTVHIHVKVHVAGNVVHTGQLYFPDATTDAVYRHAPYATRGQRTTRNAQDGIYASGGRQSTLSLRRSATGYIGTKGLVVRT
jgi:protocatechuate 3,4-dioxygenase beta subunit